MTTKTKTITLNNIARASAIIYAEALLDGCRRAKVNDPLEALMDADDFPRLLKLPTIEFAIGWLHGCAEAHGVTVTSLWEQIVPSAGRGLKKRDAELRGDA